MTKLFPSAASIALIMILSGCDYQIYTNKTNASIPENKDRVQVVFIDGKVNKELHFKNNRLHGTIKEYHSITGKLKALRHYRNGLLHGEHRTWYPDGQLSSIQHYHEGDLHGELIFFNADGSVESKHTVEKKEPIFSNTEDTL